MRCWYTPSSRDVVCSARYICNVPCTRCERSRCAASAFGRPVQNDFTITTSRRLSRVRLPGSRLHLQVRQHTCKAKHSKGTYRWAMRTQLPPPPLLCRSQAPALQAPTTATMCHQLAHTCRHPHCCAPLNGSGAGRGCCASSRRRACWGASWSAGGPCCADHGTSCRQRSGRAARGACAPGCTAS